METIIQDTIIELRKILENKVNYKKIGKKFLKF